MPRNSSGQYTLPVGNPVVTNTTITSTWANATMPDLGAEIQNSLDRSGRGSMLAQFKAFDGTLSNPGISFGNDLTMGFARLNTNEIQGIISGTKVFAMTSGALAITGTLSTTGGATFGGAVTGITDLTTTGNTILGDAVGDTLNVAGGSLQINGSGNAGFGVAPSVRLHAGSSTAGAGIAVFQNTGASTTFTAANFTNQADADLQIKVTGVGAGTKFVSIGPSLGVPVLFNMAGAEAMRLDTTGRLGVAMAPLGDTAGYGGITIEVAGPIYARQSSDTSKYLSIGCSGGSAFIEANGAGQNMLFFVSSAEAMRINNARQVGIGVAPSVAQLEVTTTGGIFTSFNSSNVNGGYSQFASSGTVFGYIGSGAQLVAGGATSDMVIRGVNNIRMSIGAAEFLGIKSDGRVYGKALHNTGTVTGTSDQFIASGTYTPTVTVVSNASAPFGNKSQWVRVGNVVTVSGSCGCTVPGAGTTTLNISLPIASNLASLADLVGSYNAPGITLGSLTGDSVNDKAQLISNPLGAGNPSFYFVFSYEVL